jgi:hypothetical protein
MDNRQEISRRAIHRNQKNSKFAKTKQTMQVEGKVAHIGQTEIVGANGFTKRLLVVDTGAQYDALTPIEFKKDKVALLDNLKVGQTVKVSINLGGREYSGKYYPSITGWKIDTIAATPSRVASTPMATQAPVYVDDLTDELPF